MTAIIVHNLRARAIRMCCALFFWLTLLPPPSAWAVPEPGVVLYGTVRSGGTPVTAGVLVLTVQAADGRRITVSEALTAPYRLIIPFDLALGSVATPELSFGLNAQQTSYTITDVRVDGIAASLVNPAQATFSMRASDRARVIAMDIDIPQAGGMALVTDHDHDGLPDAYELQNRLNPDNATDASGDPDRDGMITHDEYLAGTDPNDFESVLRIVALTPVTSFSPVRLLDTDPASGFELIWSSVAGRVYRIERGDSILGPFELLRDSVKATPPWNSFVDTGVVNAETRYYRVSTRR